jgi:hypothetical protein
MPLSAASSTHGATPPSWSSSVVSTSSPAPKSRPAARESAKSSVVMFMPKEISSAPQPRKWPASSFARARIDSTARPVAYGAPRLPDASRSAWAIAAPTSSGTCVPPGASKKAKPFCSEENRLRACSGENVTAALPPGCG